METTLPIVQRPRSVARPQSAPEAPPRQQRQAFRVSAYLRVQIRTADGDCFPAVLTDLSGTGARLVSRQPLPDGESRLDLELPRGFVEELAQRRLQYRRTLRRTYLADQHFEQACIQVRAQFAALPIRPVQRRADAPQGFHALSVHFAAPSEGIFRLVRHLEHLGLRQARQQRDEAAAVAA